MKITHHKFSWRRFAIVNRRPEYGLTLLHVGKHSFGLWIGDR